MIEADALSRRYGDLTAVDQFSCSVEKGEIFGLLGPNGSGKTTIIRMLSGQIHPSSGRAVVQGIDTTADPVGVRRCIGIIPEQESPPGFLTALEYLLFTASVRELPGARERAEWWFEFLGCEDKMDSLCKDLSRGTRQKIMIAQAFLHEPKVALIDEPLINLDPVMQQKVLTFIQDYVKRGNTVFLSTHILAVAEEICDRLAILHRGKTLYTGPVGPIRSGEGGLSGFFFSVVGQDGTS